MTDRPHKDRRQNGLQSHRPELPDQAEDNFQDVQIAPRSDRDNINRLQRLVGNRVTQRLLLQRHSQSGSTTVSNGQGFVERLISQQTTDTAANDGGGEKIQRYALSGGDASNLVEEKYASADAAAGLHFSTFSSCIGVVGRKGDKIVGAHLVRVGADGEPPDVSSVVSALSGIEDGMMFGFLGNWENDIKGEIAKGLGIMDWRPMESQNGWHVTWQDDDWQVNSV